MSNYEGHVAAQQAKGFDAGIAHGIIPPEEDGPSQLEVFAQNYAAGQAAIEELELLKPVLAYAISKLDRKQLKVSLSEQGALVNDWALQMKQEKNGAIVFRAVKA